MLQPSPTQQVHARRWAQVFQQLNQRPTFRNGRAGEKTTIRDVEVAGVQMVYAVGLMERDGAISFQSQKFLLTQLDPLEAWLEKLEQYGADGPPHESATWGLREVEYKEVLKLLQSRVDRPTDWSSPVKAIDSLRLPTAFRLKFTDAAKRSAFTKAAAIGEFHPDLEGLSKGSALAIALSQFGLGFRPLKNPDGNYFVEVDAGNESSNMFPVGWKNNAPITTLVPALSKTVPIDLQDAELDALIGLIANKLEVPYAYSASELLAQGSDISRIKYTRKPDRRSPYSLMRIIGKAHHIGLSLRTDEAGQVFLWVTTEADYRAFRNRFAHIKPIP